MTMKHHGLLTQIGNVASRSHLTSSRDDERQAATRQQVVAAGQRLWASARALTNSNADAADLVTETTIRALASTTAPSEPSRFKSWIHGVMRRAAADDIRSRREVTADPVTIERLAGDDGWSERRQVAVLTTRQAFEQLSTEHQQVLALVDVAGMTYEEAAAQLGVPIGTIKSRVARARVAMLDAMKQGGIDPTGTAPQ